MTLTKKTRKVWRKIINSAREVEAFGVNFVFTDADMEQALNKIDALEEQIRKLEAFRGKVYNHG